MKDMSPSPQTTDFNKRDVEQIVANMFNSNRTVASMTDTKSDGMKMTITFTNKNPDGSGQTVTRSFVSEEAAKYAKDHAEGMRLKHHSCDRSHDFQSNPTRVVSVQFYR